MSDFCLYASRTGEAQTSDWLSRAGAALAADASPREWSTFSSPSLSLGFWEMPGSDVEKPAVSMDGRFYLWLLGEVFGGPQPLNWSAASETRTLPFRERLLGNILSKGFGFLSQVDGEYAVILWDSSSATISVATDRFCAIPVYWTQTPDFFAVATGGRGLLSLPGVSCDPNQQALWEAVTFGGYRLGEGTNVVSVKMVPSSTELRWQAGAVSLKKYWQWKNIRPLTPAPTIPEAVEELHSIWRKALAARLEGAIRPGHTLSGGLDSRAILAESFRQTPSWLSITFGVPGSDEVTYARMAAAQAGTDWLFHPLYVKGSPDWLEIRSSFIQQTDGLIELGDLMHLETLHLQRRLLDLHISGYIGGAISSAYYSQILTAADTMLALPFYGTSIGFDYHEALKVIERRCECLDGGEPFWLIFEDKASQATSRWSSAWRPWFRVRRPFTAYSLFEFGQSMPRTYDTLYEQWTVTRYPDFFRAIPNQKTGLPVLTSKWRWQAERALRYARRKSFPWLKRLRPSIAPRIRSATADDQVWRLPGNVERIASTILRSQSCSAEILGRDRLRAFVEKWATSADAPAQVIGALYAFESYHRDLPAFLASARASAPYLRPARRCAAEKGS